MHHMDACHETFRRLCEIAEYREEGSSPFLVADLVHQEDLFKIQEKIGDTLLKLAQAIGLEDELVKRFPYAFEPLEVESPE